MNIVIGKGLYYVKVCMYVRMYNIQLLFVVLVLCIYVCTYV